MAIDKAATCFGEMILGETITGLLLCVRCLSPRKAIAVGGLTPPSAVCTDSAVSVPKSCVTNTKLVYCFLGYRPGGELNADFAFEPLHGDKRLVKLKAVAVKFPVVL